jgi:large-conductance mechanosensitive channel
LALARPLSHWIEFIAVPVATSLMETQAVILILVVLSPLFQVASGSIPLGEVTVTCLLLGLQWWAMLVRRFWRRDAEDQRVGALHISSLLLAALIVFGLSIAQPGSFLAFFVVGAVVIWCWKRGMDWARTGLSDEHSIATFRIGFCVLLLGLVLGLLLQDATGSLLLGFLARALPIFFISGLIGLSFTRLGLIRKENARHSPGGADPTRSWLIALTLLWGLVVVLALVFESFSFTSILAVMSFLWNILGTIVNWIAYALFFLLSPLLSLITLNQGKLPELKQQDQHLVQKPLSMVRSQQIPPEVILIGQIVLLLIVAGVILLVVRAIVRSWRVDQDEDEEEEREALSVQDILKNRRDERRKRKKEAVLALEDLDPTSARARYRELLQMVAEKSENLARRSEETPAEYQRRLLLHIEQDAVDTPDAAPTSATILNELTQVYMRERYGGKQTDAAHKSYLATWIPQLLQRLRGRPLS